MNVKIDEKQRHFKLLNFNKNWKKNNAEVDEI